jgi:hypothetical protein
MVNFITTQRTGAAAKRAATHPMRRTCTALVSGVALMAASAGPASADPGATFPEQPGTSLQSGCDAILGNPNNAFYNRAPVAAAITTGLTVDACFGG